MLPLPRGPPPGDDLQFVRVSSLATALDKININISMETILATIGELEEDEAQRARVNLTAQHAQRHAALSQLALQTPQPTAGLQITTVSHFVPEPSEPANVDPLAEKRRRPLLELTKEAFPDGKVPDPFMVA